MKFKCKTVSYEKCKVSKYCCRTMKREIKLGTIELSISEKEAIIKTYDDGFDNNMSIKYCPFCGTRIYYKEVD